MTEDEPACARSTLEHGRGTVLVVDDEANARKALVELLTLEGYDVDSASDGRKALERMAEREPQVVLTDLKMPVLDGIELLRRGKERWPETAFVVMTAFGSIDTAVEAIKLGAESYLTKPVDVGALSAIVARALEKARLSSEAAQLRRRLDARYGFDRIVGDHPSMQKLFKLMQQVGRSRATVLVHGETGTGKELIASAIHHCSPRSQGAFVALNCAALSENLLESELFGHEKGSFTGALARRQGRFEQADGGTLFLDEVSEIPMPLQVKLLRFLQERCFERVGGNETLNVDVRIVAATNKDLVEQVKEGRFREDLFYRLNVIALEVPPLRARKSDIPLLAEHFMREHARANGFAVKRFTDRAVRALMEYAWPGNVRELENAVERAVVLTTSDTIDVEHLPILAGSSQADSIRVLVPGVTLAELERAAIMQALEAAGGSTAQAATLLGISQRKIQYRLKEWGVQGGAELSLTELDDPNEQEPA